MFLTWTGDSLRTGKSSRYTNNAKVNSAFHNKSQWNFGFGKRVFA